MKVNHQKLIGTGLGLATAAVAVGCNLDVCLRTLKTIDARVASSLPTSLQSIRWVAYSTLTLGAVAGLARFIELETDSKPPSSKVDIDETIEFYTALDGALKTGDMKTAVKLVKQALERGHLDVNNKHDDDDTLLTWAANAGCTEIVTVLLEQNDIEVDIADRCGFTALMCASYWGHADIVTLLLNHGADTGATSGDYTALQYAQQQKQMEIVTLLQNA